MEKEHLTKIYFVRHGERIHIPNSKDIGLVIPGPGLTKKGISQAQYVANQLLKINEKVDKIYSSTMLRAIQTSDIIAKKLKKKVERIPELGEFKENVYKNHFHKISFWKSYIKHKKSIKKLNELLKKDKGKTIIIVAHGQLIKGLIGAKLGLPRKRRAKFRQNNCHVSFLTFNNLDLERIVYLNNKNTNQNKLSQK